jgi:hypothetical protein
VPDRHEGMVAEVGLAGLGQQDKPARNSDRSLAVRLDGSTEDEAYAGIETGLGRSVLLLTARYFQADAISFPGLASTDRLTTWLVGTRKILASQPGLRREYRVQPERNIGLLRRSPAFGAIVSVPAVLAGQLCLHVTLCWGVGMGRQLCAPRIVLLVIL